MSPYTACNVPICFDPTVPDTEEATDTWIVTAVAPPARLPKPPGHVSVCPLTFGAGPDVVET